MIDDTVTYWYVRAIMLSKGQMVLDASSQRIRPGPVVAAQTSLNSFCEHVRASDKS